MHDSKPQDFFHQKKPVKTTGFALNKGAPDIARNTRKA